MRFLLNPEKKIGAGPTKTAKKHKGTRDPFAIRVRAAFLGSVIVMSLEAK